MKAIEAESAECIIHCKEKKHETFWCTSVVWRVCLSRVKPAETWQFGFNAYLNQENMSYIFQTTISLSKKFIGGLISRTKSFYFYKMDGSQHLERLNVQRPILRYFKITNVKITKMGYSIFFLIIQIIRTLKIYYNLLN